MNQTDDSRRAPGRGHSVKVVQTARPRLAPLAKLGNERFHLVWLGEVQRPASATSATGHIVVARFASDTKQFNIPLPLPALPLLALGSLWQEGLYVGLGSAKTAKVTVDVTALAEAHRTALDPYEVLSPAVYPLSMGKRSPCRLLPVTSGPELIVPTSELLRTSYFFDHRLIEPMLSGAFANPALGSSLRLPWVPEGTRRLSDAEVMLTHRQGIGEPLARRLSRLLFDEAAQRSIAKLSVAYRQASLQSAFLLPSVEPTFEHRAQWHIRYIDVPEYKQHPQRRLVLTILGQEQALPYERLILLADKDSRQGANSEDPDLKPYARRSTSIVLPDEGTLALYGGAGEAGTDSAPVAGLAFHDNVFEIPIVRPAKSWQSYRSQGGMPDAAVPVHGAATDPTANPVPGLASQRDGDPMAASGSGIGGTIQTPPALVDVRPMFDDLVRTLQPMLPAWQIDYLDTPNASAGVIKVQHFKSKAIRPFLVLHLQRGLRHVYVIKAGPLADHEHFRLLLCEELNGVALSLSMLGQWLSRFPYPERNKWIDSSYRRRLALRHDALVHQPRPPGSTPAEVQRKFVERVAGRVAGFVA